MFLIFILLALLSLLPNLHRYPFKGEESLRVQVAFEMGHFGNYLQPTFLGEPYFNKPPLFNWLILLYSHIIPWSEMTARAVSLTFLMLTTFMVGVFTHILFRSPSLSFLSSLVFLTFGNVFFFYGFLAEIDITFTFFVSLGIFLLYLWWTGSRMAGLFAGFAFGIAFLLKGLPAYAFLGMSLLALVLYSKKMSLLFGTSTLYLYVPALFVPLLWILQVPDPITYLENLWRESFSRVGGEFSRLKHMLLFPFINLKDLLPWSFLFLLSLYAIRREFHFPTPLKVLALIFLLNYLPYWISDSAGRYIMPLYPLLAVLFSYYLHKAMKFNAFKRLFFLTLSTVILLKFLHGLFFFPYAESMETSRKKLAQKMLKLIDKEDPIACECPQEKSVCLYVGLWKGEPLRSLVKTQNAKYAIVCGRSVGISLAEFKLKDKAIRLERLEKD